VLDVPFPQLADRSIQPLVIDAHEVSRIGLAVLLRGQPWVARCLLARDEAQARELARRHRPAVAILDISNMGPFVASATASLRQAHPGIQIVLTARCAVELPAPPRRLGAASYVPPPSSSDEVLRAVRAALLAEAPPAPEDPSPGDRSPGDPPLNELSERERELLLLISTGATNREIAQTLHLGPDSIKKNASVLYRKLGVRNRIEAAGYASSLFGQDQR
jgi:DNA-binding NarL/FixJ family response regulator